MFHVLRRASTSVAALAILGCTGDSPVEPVLVSEGMSATVPTASAPRAESPNATSTTDRADSAPSLVIPIAVAAALSPPATVTATPLSRPSLGNREGSRSLGEMSREQSLGFQNDAPNEECLSEGAYIGSWQLRYSGYGCVGLTAQNGGTSLSMQPMTATVIDETHAPLLLGPVYGDQLMLTTRLETVRQLRKNAEPNAWEVAWLLWQYQDDEHFYYFIPKPNGWEVGKRDPAYPGGQRFLATGIEQKFPVGHTYNVQITHRGNVFSIVVDGATLTTFTDTERPYVSGRIALYSEDAEIKVHQVSVRTGAF
ncbi:MAG: hypothetical protein ABJB74_03940 [Gemmatimonas sp.]